MHKDPRHRDAFVATLPIAGKDGTISTRMQRHARRRERRRQDRVDLERPRAVRLRPHADGETLVFSILANNFTIPAATVNWIADLAVEALANYTRR